jgi:hypothetical protein
MTAGAKDVGRRLHVVADRDPLTPARGIILFVATIALTAVAVATTIGWLLT